MCGGFLEHPEDPAKSSPVQGAENNPSIWETNVVKVWLKSTGWTNFNFDQCRFGQVIEKPTTIASNLDLKAFQETRCNHTFKHKAYGINSSDLARYPWPMMQVLATAIVDHTKKKSVTGSRDDAITPQTPPRSQKYRSAEATTPGTPEKLIETKNKVIKNCLLTSCPAPQCPLAIVVCRRCNFPFHAECLIRHNQTRHMRRNVSHHDDSRHPGGSEGKPQSDKSDISSTMRNACPVQEGTLAGSERQTQQTSDRPTTRPIPHDLLETSSREEIVQSGFKARPLRDGAGKPSPGRLCPPCRPTPRLYSMGKQIEKIISPTLLVFCNNLALRNADHPFKQETLDEIRRVMDVSKTHEITHGQPFYLSLIEHLAILARDPDWSFPREITNGVPLGVTSPTLKSPGIWPLKTELTDFEQDQEKIPNPFGHPNYQSAIIAENTIEMTFEEEKKLDMVEGPMEADEAALRCGCLPHQLCPGPLGAVEELDKIRTIYDGSIGLQNEHIQRNTLEKTTSPTVADCLHAVHWLHHARDSQGDRVPARNEENGWSQPSPNTTWWLLKADVTKAHRRIKVKQEDWRYQVAVNKGKFWINKVGTYGMASAQLYWGRMAALLLRILYSLFPEVDWQFVYVDDFAWLIRGQQAFLQAACILVTLIALGLPLSWKKTGLGSTNIWLGFLIHLKEPSIQMAPTKHILIMEALGKLQRGAPFSLKELEKVLGRLQWATHCCPVTKPFLQPLWTWKSAMMKTKRSKVAGRPSKLIRKIGQWLYDMLNEVTVSLSPFSTYNQWHGASDASATEERIGIGGWIADTHPPQQKQVLWFMLEPTRQTHPWAFEAINPQRMIAALEMYGSLLLFTALMTKIKPESGSTRTAFLTDNQGNAYAMLKGAARKWPSAAFLMQILRTAQHNKTMVASQHVYRELNQWADDLSNGDAKNFDPVNRIDHRELESSMEIVNTLLTIAERRPGP